MQAYCDSKLLLTAFAFALSRRWPGVLSNAVDPGWVATRMGGPQAPDDLASGADTQVWLAAGTSAHAPVSGAVVVVALAAAVATVATACASTPAPTEPSRSDVAGPTSLANTTEPAPTAPAAQEELMAPSVPITITIGETVLDAELWDNPTAADLADRLPLTLHFSDFGAVEKTARLPRPLTMDGVPERGGPRAVRHRLLQPNQVLALYYRDVGFWPGIVRLGTFTDPAGVVSSQQRPFDAELRRV